MIFLGDVAAPTAEVPDASVLNRLRHDDELVVANLEGSLADPRPALLSERVVFNHPAVVDYLLALNAKVVSLANNHVMDLPGDLPRTIQGLRSRGLLPVGAGENSEEAARAVVALDGGVPAAFLGFGWAPIGCVPARRSRQGVQPLTRKQVLRSIERARMDYPHHHLVLLPHWNYELELYPQPMHRALAFEAIDAGASAVIGAHPHCVQGIEAYKGAPIVYSLGNWYFPHGAYLGGKLSFPDISLRQLAFQWRPGTDEMTCHWFRYSPAENAITPVRSESLKDSAEVHQLTPFAGMTPREYVGWFAAHRRKRKLLPIYRRPDAVIGNWTRDRWVAVRHRLITAAFSAGVKGAPR